MRAELQEEGILPKWRVQGCHVGLEPQRSRNTAYCFCQMVHLQHKEQTEAVHT